MKTYTAGELQAVLRAHAAWLRNENGERADLRDANLSDADLRGADLRYANLRGANLSYAILRDANLSDADLSDAILRDANLRGANLRYAKLSGADLRYANLRGANLSYAILRDANLSDADLSDAILRDANLSDVQELDSAIMPGGYTFAVYNSDVVPALLTAGGKSLAEVVSTSWDCHQWTNCPMAVAFGVHDLDDIPPLYREQAQLFVQLFDQGLLPRPTPPNVRIEGSPAA